MVKLCLIGAGRAGMIHGTNLANRIRGAELTAICDPDEGSLARACKDLGIEKGFGDYGEALERGDFGAVVVATPTKHHQEIVVAAARAGKHILCEKPMAMDVGQCEAMIAAAQESNVKLQIGFMRRFSRDFVAARERVDAGEIGDVVMVRSITYGPSTPKAWMYDISKSNGPLAEVNSHDIDTLRWFTGSEFSKVHAIAGNYRCDEARGDFPDFYDNVIMNAVFENGMQGSIAGAQGVRYGYDSRCEVLGTKGIIFIGGLNDGSMSCCNNDGMFRRVVRSWTDLYAESYLKEDCHFVECIREGKVPRVRGMDGLRAVEVVNAGNRSIRQGKVIEIQR